MMEKEIEFKKVITDGKNTSTFIQFKNGGMSFTVTSEEESQLERIEKKMDRILEFLESKDSSISFYKPLRASFFLSEFWKYKSALRTVKKIYH